MAIGEKTTLGELNEQVQEASAWLDLLHIEMGKVIVGQRSMIDRLLIGVLTNGHILLEGVPGLAKTLVIKTLARAFNVRFQRIQFTPDLLPADILGTLIYNPKEGDFFTKKGPIFANFVLADEINRSPAKVQSALLEAMQERQVTLGDTTFRLEEPFLVLATQNPIEQEGTYPLPEAQMDRFMLKLRVDYPSRDEERKILDTMGVTQPQLEVEPIISPSHILESRKIIDQIYMDPKVRDYVVDLVFATRNPAQFGLPYDGLIHIGASPRATIALTLTAKAWAFLKRRGYVTPQDVKSMAVDVLRHRVVVSYEAEAEGVTSETIVKKLLDTIPVP
jgi:MoxR-like ATPase